MRNIMALLLIAVLCSSCITTSNLDEADWDTMLEKAELAVEMANQVYALWDLTHELIGTPESEIAEKRLAFRQRIDAAESYLEYVKNLITKHT